mmetsp:Transcript_8834/g.13109  ORF Transcript_8834/g.13109 Transcript_8834/m.13109 type:complete len:240 (+) Transcript_8834:22-741(+)
MKESNCQHSSDHQLFLNRQKFFTAIEQSDLVSLKSFIHHDSFDLRLKDFDGFNGLLRAVESGNLSVFNLLVDCHLDIYVKEPMFGESVLHIASKLGHLSIVNRLVSLGFNLHLLSTHGDSALHSASIYGHLPIVRRLLSLGLDPSLKNSSGYSPLHLAVRFNHLDLVDFFLNSACVSSIIRDVNLCTPLHLAIQSSNVLMVSLFLNSPSFCFSDHSYDGGSLLHYLVPIFGIYDSLLPS